MQGGSTLRILKKYITGLQNWKFSTLTYLSGHCNLGFRVISYKTILLFHSKLFSKWKNSLIQYVDKEKKHFCKFQKVHDGSKNIENVFFFSMKELLELNKGLDIDSKKSIILLPFLGFRITRDVDIDICGC
jgi:hypothetical protein